MNSLWFDSLFTFVLLPSGSCFLFFLGMSWLLICPPCVPAFLDRSLLLCRLSPVWGASGMGAVKRWQSKVGNLCVAHLVCVFLLPGGHWLESCNDKSKLRGPLPYSGQSSEVSTPSSLYMEYGKWVLGRPGCHCVFALPLCPLSFELCGSSQLSGGCIPYSRTLRSIIFHLCARSPTALPFLLLRSDFGVPPSLMPWVLLPWMSVEPDGVALWVGQRDLERRPLSVWA